MNKTILKVMTCGNVDDGKSTLLGRFLFETNNISIDQSEYLKRIQQYFLSKNSEHEIDYSMLLDGLIDEKEQGITIDIAFKFFNLVSKNLFILPQHKFSLSRYTYYNYLIYFYLQFLPMLGVTLNDMTSFLLSIHRLKLRL